MKTKSRLIVTAISLAAAAPLALSQAGAATSSTNGEMSSSTGAIGEAGQGLTHLPSRLGQIRNSELPILALGVQELGLSGSFDWSNDTVYRTDLTYGWFVSDCWLFGIKTGLSGVNSDVSVLAGLFVEYNYLTGTKWVPFAGGSASYKRVDNGDSNDGLDTTLEFGVKYFLRSNMAISTSIAGGWFTAGDNGDDGFSSRVNFGLRYYF